MTEPPAHPRVAIDALRRRVAVVGREALPIDRATGRVLVEPVVTDRDSPACDVSAMDGYAVALRDAAPGRALPVAGEVVMGQAPPALPTGAAVRVFTGGAVPAGADAVIPRERLDERGDTVVLPADAAPIRAGQHIRRRGENAPAGQAVVAAGSAVTPAVAGTAALFGVAELAVFRRVRVAVVTTGSEVVTDARAVEPWHVRDANGPILAAHLRRCPWVEPAGRWHVDEDAGRIEAVLREALSAADAVWVTGGVSMGDHDTVPDAARAAGVEVAFHRLAVRPGKPILGGATADGRALLGLPGNPVSVATAARVFGDALLRHAAGFSAMHEPGVPVALESDLGKTVPLWWYRPVRWVGGRAGDPRVELVTSMGSGDLPAAARSDGFVEVPPGSATLDRVRYWSW